MEQHRRLARAWLGLTAALGLHVFDEAVTGFLDVYNPTVRELRARFEWFPMPTFGFQEWLFGLLVVLAAMLVASQAVSRGSKWMRPVAWFAAVLMIANALGHTAGTVFGRTVESVRFARPMPGFYSSPFLLGAALVLISRLRERME